MDTGQVTKVRYVMLLLWPSLAGSFVLIRVVVMLFVSGIQKPGRHRQVVQPDHYVYVCWTICD